MSDLLARAQASKAWRAWNRYGAARGNVLAGGIAYVAFFSVFPALALGFTVFGLVVGGRVDMQERVADYVNDAFGSTLIGLPGDDAFVSIDTLVQGDLLTVTGALGIGLLLFSGLGWVDAMRQGIRAMFALPDEGNPVLRKLFDVAVLAIVGLGVLASVIVTVALSAATGAVLTWLGVASTAGQVTVQILVELAVVALDIVLFLMFFRVLAQVRQPWGDLLGGAVIGAVGLHVLKLSGGLLLRTVSGNRFLASAAIVVGLLLWFNLIGRITLLAAAWAATTVADRDQRLAVAGPQSRAAQAAPDRAADLVPGYGQRAVDRTTLAAGAVLGAVLGVAVGGLTRSVRLLAGAARRRSDDD